MDKAEIKLIYAQVGGAEALRNSLKISGIKFDDKKLSHDEFKAYNSKGPILEVNGVQYKYAMPALRFIGRVNKNWGFPADPFEAAQIDELLDETSELRKKIGAAGRLGGDAMIERNNEISDVELPTLLEKMDNMVEATDKGTVLATGTSVIDTEVASLVSWLLRGTIEGIPTNCLDEFNNLKRLQYELMRHKAIGRNKPKAGDF